MTQGLTAQVRLQEKREVPSSKNLLGWLKVGAVATAITFIYTYITVNRNRCH